MSIQSNITCSALIFFYRFPVIFNLILSYSVFQHSLQTSSRHQSQESPGALRPFSEVYHFNRQGWKRPLEITTSAGWSISSDLCPCFFSMSTTGDSTASLGNPSQCFTTIPRESLFKQNFLHINCLLPLVLSLYTTKKNLCPPAFPGLYLQFNLSSS